MSIVGDVRGNVELVMQFSLLIMIISLAAFNIALKKLSDESTTNSGTR
jgi:hypothetical protein